MSADSFVASLVRHLTAIPLHGPFRSELDLEKVVAAAVRQFTTQALGLDDPALEEVVFTHGDDRHSKALWTASKPHQNVVAFGCANTSDVFIRHSQIGTIYIELKLSKARGLKSNSLPGDLQRSVGQSVIASLKHRHVICMIVTQGQRRDRDGDMAENLRKALWEKHGIALVVRGTGSPKT
jgi:hypothetical protein